MKLIKLDYLIDQSYGEMDGQCKQVTGYAIDYPEARLCVRKRGKHDWCVDHYDTGLAISIPGYWSSLRPIRSKKRAAKLAVEYIAEKIKSGDYHRALAKYIPATAEAL